jgi:hypothetical protein
MAPPRSSLTSSFPVVDAGSEVVCPLRNQDGSSCRKRCVGEKRYRSMQEHIRRAHPDHYIAKLPATEESFYLMVNTPPSERHNQQPHQHELHHTQQQHQSLQQSLLQHIPPPELRHAPHSFPNDRYHHHRDIGFPETPRTHPDDFAHNHGRGPVSHPVNAATALAQLHSHKGDSDWESEPDTSFSDSDRRIPRTSIELPPILSNDLASPLHLSRPRDILPSLLAGSPPGRSSTLPPLQRPLGSGRPRKPSVSKRGREAHHQKKRSRGTGAEVLRRIDDRLRPGHNERKALSAEPSADFGKRWEDLIVAADQAASAAGDLDEERTPVSTWHPTLVPFTPPLTVSPPSLSSAQVPQSPVPIQRVSLPPSSNHAQTRAAVAAHQNHQASPLHQALTPPNYTQEPFPSVESNGSAGSGGVLGLSGAPDPFTMEPRGILNDPSSNFSSQNTQIYCAACHNASYLRESFACTECICGLCQACVDVLLAEQGARRQCPQCFTIGGKFKPFQLDIR